MDDREILEYAQSRIMVLNRQVKTAKLEGQMNGAHDYGSFVYKLLGRISELQQLARVIRSKSMLKHNSRMRRQVEKNLAARQALNRRLRESKGSDA